jgi:hypothetical protein
MNKVPMPARHEPCRLVHSVIMGKSPQPGRGSCPREWCKSGGGFALAGRVGRYRQAAATWGSLTRGSSLNGAMVSSVM